MEVEFSIIMASKLENYYGGAVDRVMKFKRAVDSVTSQNFKGWELIIVSDNCMVTMDTVLDTYNDSPGIVGFFLPGKRALFNGLPRNTGIESARGQWIIYLDTDDSFAHGYLSKLSQAIKKAPNQGGIYWVHDLIFKNGEFIPRQCTPIKGKCGTSNIIHPASTEIRWATQGQYAHDWMFIKSLKSAHGSGVLLEPIGYKVHHIPGRYDI